MRGDPHIDPSAPAVTGGDDRAPTRAGPPRMKSIWPPTPEYIL
jgi:hypothetical protein